MTHSTWIEIDLKAIAHNMLAIASLVAPDAKIMAVVKADAYGHGAVPVAKTVLAHGASSLAVARLGEALILRQEGIRCPILILGYTPPSQYQELIKHGLTQTVYSGDMASALSAAANQAGKKISAHIKIDTGMGRLGLLPNQNALAQIADIVALPGLKVEGIYTHFAKADCHDKDYINYQYRQFDTLLHQLAAQGISFNFRHAANSAAIIDHPETHLDMVRAGIIMYGLYPSAAVDHARLNLKPALSLKTTVAQLKQLPAGCAIGYGCCYTTTANNETIATLPLGYGDGFTRTLTAGEVLIQGQRVPVVGKICMDQCMVNLGSHSSCRVGDQVVVIGSQQEEYIAVEELASKLNTISYEILCMLKDRVPRVYPT